MKLRKYTNCSFIILFSDLRSSTFALNSVDND
jgi:hypothetical protein